MASTINITLRRFYDMHVHLRRGQILFEVLPYTMDYCSYALIMPNTRPQAILCAQDLIAYREEIRQTMLKYLLLYDFQPLMTIEIRDNTTPDMVSAAHRVGAVAGKVYPLGVTTNSDEGLRDFFSPAILETFAAMQELGMLLLLHGEKKGDRILVTDRERIFLDTFLQLVERFPKLKIVLEHISTRAAVGVVARLGPSVAATITAHHLCMTLNDVVGDGVHPHNACMPIPKGFDDMDALLVAATSGNPKFFLGSDSAPHPKEKKECADGACGVYSAPILPQLLVEIFEKQCALSKLQNFTSTFGAQFYSLPLHEGTIKLERKEWTVPKQCSSIVPCMAGKKLQWQLVK